MVEKGDTEVMNKIILADNQELFRAGTAKILTIDHGFRIIARCGGAERLYQTLEAFRGSILLFASALKLDISLLVERVRAQVSLCIVIAEAGESAGSYLSAGVHGAVHRTVTGPALIDCVRRVVRGESGVYVPGLRSGLPVQEEDSVGARARDRLTPREMQIVALILQGCKNKEIAMRLTTTEQVIKNYLRHIYDKTGVSDRLELALFTIHHRMLAKAVLSGEDSRRDNGLSPSAS
jgi:DNA-binding NarL/FixJ family response regulator